MFMVDHFYIEVYVGKVEMLSKCKRKFLACELLTLIELPGGFVPTRYEVKYPS